MIVHGKILACLFAAIGVLLGTGWVFAATLPHPILVFPGMALVVALVAFGGAVRQSKFDQPILRLLSGILISGLFLVAVAMPIGVKRFWTEQQVRQLPILADASTYISHHSIVSGDGYPDYGAYFETSLPLDDATNAIEEEFRRDGWKVVLDDRMSEGHFRHYRCYRGNTAVVCDLSQWPPTSKTTIHIKHQDWWLSLIE